MSFKSSRPLPGAEPQRSKKNTPVFDLGGNSRSKAPARLLDQQRGFSGGPQRALLARSKASPAPPQYPLRGRVPERVKQALPAVLALAGPTTPDWVEYPHDWAAEQPCSIAPYELRRVVDMALAGGDVDGCNLPGAVDLARGVLRANTLADFFRRSEDLYCPEADDPLIHQRPDILYRLDLEEAKAKQGRGRVRTSEPRSESHGEYGAETYMLPNGRVGFRNGLPAITRRVIKVMGLNDYSERANVRFKDGMTKRVDRQKAAEAPRKPGPKPKFGVSMSDAARQAKRRAERRGIPFVLANHLNLEAPNARNSRNDRRPSNRSHNRASTRRPDLQATVAGANALDADGT